MATIDIDNLSFFEEGIEDVINETTEIPEEPIEEQEETEPQGQHEQEPGEDENLNVFNVIVKSLNERGITELPEDEDYDEESFVSSLYEQAKQTVLSDLGVDDKRTQDVLRYIASGGDLTRLSEFYSQNAFSTSDLDDEDYQEQIIREHYLSKGISERRISTIIQDLKDDGELEFEAKEIYSKKDEEFRKKEQEFIKRQEEAKRIEDEKQQQYKKILDKNLNSGKSYLGVDVTETQRKQLKEWLNKPTEYTHTDGKKYKLTKAQIKQIELQKDPEAYAQFTLAVQLMLMNGFKNPTREAEIATKTTKSAWDKIKLPSGKGFRQPKENIDNIEF